MHGQRERKELVTYSICVSHYLHLDCAGYQPEGEIQSRSSVSMSESQQPSKQTGHRLALKKKYTFYLSVFVVHYHHSTRFLSICFIVTQLGVFVTHVLPLLRWDMSYCYSARSFLVDFLTFTYCFYDRLLPLLLMSTL